MIPAKLRATQRSQRRDDAAQTERYRKPRKKSGGRIALFVCCIACILGTACYLIFVYSNIPFIQFWRHIYIETAMTTGEHQWLATAFIPHDEIRSVMAEKNTGVNVIGGINNLTRADQPKWVWDKEGTGGTGTDTPANNDILGLEQMSVGSKDYVGNTVVICDKEEGLFVSRIEQGNFKGLIMLVDDPARIYLAFSSTRGVQGTRICAMMKEYGAVAGINASGFPDWNGNGTGGEVTGLCCGSGEYWGTYAPGYASIVLTGSNNLVAGNIPNWSKYDIRDGMQFGPVLIANGVIQVKGSAGYGLQPRTALGQREDGVIVMLVIDGRDPLYSVGCTVGDMAQIMASYGVINAGCCDGGSSCVLAYDNKVLNRNSSANPAYGRMLPNAFLIRSKKDMPS